MGTIHDFSNYKALREEAMDSGDLVEVYVLRNRLDGLTLEQITAKAIKSQICRQSASLGYACAIAYTLIAASTLFYATSAHPLKQQAIMRSATGNFNRETDDLD